MSNPRRTPRGARFRCIGLFGERFRGPSVTLIRPP
jgi:hypothetical protein